MTEKTSLRIDLDKVLRERIPSYYRWLPSPLIGALTRFIRQDELNALMESNDGRYDADFCRGVLSDLNTTYRIKYPERLPKPSDRRAIYVCNHPLGALDGIIIIDLLSQKYGPGIKFVVNDLLNVLTPLKNTFLPVNKHGRQSRGSSEAIEQAFESDDPVIMFPAGLVSRRSNDGSISDLTWNKMFITRAIRHKRDIIPMHFNGTNSNFFYKFAQWRQRLGIKFNIEMICLPREVFGCRDKQFEITIGKRIAYESLTAGSGNDALAEAQKIKQIVYSLG